MRGAALAVARAAARPLARGARAGSSVAAAAAERVPLGTFGERLSLGDRMGHLESGTLAPLADGAAVATDERTSVMATACAEQAEAPQLSVEFRAKAAAAGQIPSHVLRRELGPREADVVTARMVDRALRPLLGTGASARAVQVICTTLSHDGKGDEQVLALNAASTALGLAGYAGWGGPLASVRVGCRESAAGPELVAFPERHGSLNLDSARGDVFDVLLSGTREGGVLMVELTCATPASPELVCSALRFGVDQFASLWEAQEALVRAAGKACGNDPSSFSVRLGGDGAAAEDEGIQPERVDQLLAAGSSVGVHGRDPLPDSISDLAQDGREASARRRARHQSEEVCPGAAAEVRPDGRQADEGRPEEASHGLLPRVHGSGMFSRGETSVLGSVTLGRTYEMLTLHPYCGPKQVKAFMLHYEQLPYSAGETGRVGLNRKMVSDGELAERALRPVLPTVEDLPYAVRASCEATSSDGSDAMAAVCATTLALVSAGVPIREPVAGATVALGGRGGRLLVDPVASEESACSQLIRVAGTPSGLTALQLETRNGARGASLDALCAAIERANAAVLDTLNGLSVKPPAQGMLAPHVPRSHRLALEDGQVRKLIGVRGATLRQLETELGVEIDVDGPAGAAWVYTANEEELQQALARIDEVLWEPSVGEIIGCEVTSTRPFGAFVRSLKGVNLEGLVHISELDSRRVSKVEDVVQVGDTIELMLLGWDGARMRLSRRGALNPSFARLPPIEASAPSEAAGGPASRGRRLGPISLRLRTAPPPPPPPPPPPLTTRALAVVSALLSRLRSLLNRVSFPKWGPK